MTMRASSLEALLLLARLYVMHEKHGKARVLLEGLFDLEPEDERVLRLLAYALLKAGEYEQSLGKLRVIDELRKNELSEYTQDAEDTACLLRLKAAALWGLQRKEEARTALEQSIACMRQDKGNGIHS
jgi:Flp pilus assembly protein TadD